jgi:hypothetical protein
MLLPRLCYLEVVLGECQLPKKQKAMPTAVKIKAGKYGSAIGLLLEHGCAFQTRHERTLIVKYFFSAYCILMAMFGDRDWCCSGSG